MKKILLAVSFCTVAGCVAGCSSLPSVDPEVTDARKNQLKQQWKNIEDNVNSQRLLKPNIISNNFRQPSNKKEKCLIGEADVFMDESLSIYWDGGCKNGFAYGLGREIVKGPYTHVEEITFHDREKEVIFNNSHLIWHRDYIGKTTRYLLSYTNNYSLGNIIYIEDSDKFDIKQTIGKHDGSIFYGKVISILPGVITVSANSLLLYLFGEFNDPTIKGNFKGGVYERETNAPLGLEFIGYKDGSVINTYNGQLVATPDNYWLDFEAQIRMANNEYNKGVNAYKQVQNMVERYLYKACGNEPVPEGIPKELYKTICTWDMQFVDKINNVIASNKEKIDQKIIQMNNERLIQAREIEARAAQERVEAEKDKAKAIKDLQNEMSKPKNTTCMDLGFGMVNCRTF